MKEKAAGALKIDSVFSLDREYLISIKQKSAEETRSTVSRKYT